MTLQVKILESVHELGAASWDSLADRCPDSTVFQRFGWIEAWTRTIGGSNVRPWLVTAFEDDELVGLAPLCSRSDRHSPRSRTRVTFLGSGHSDYHVFLARHGSPTIVEALLDGLHESLPRAAVIELSEIPQFSTLALCLATRGRSAGIDGLAATACPRLQIRDNTAHVLRIEQKSGARRRESRLRRAGRMTMEHLTDPAATKAMLGEFFDQHVRRWHSTPHPSLFERQRNRDFYNALIDSTSLAGRVLFSIVYLDGRPVAQHFGLISRNDLLWYKPSYDVEFARFSPGDVLLSNLVAYARERGFDALDFTRGNEAFKARYSSHVEFNRSFLWLRHGLSRFGIRAERSARRAARGLLRAARTANSL